MSKPIDNAANRAGTFAAVSGAIGRRASTFLNLYRALTTTAAGRRKAPPIETGNEERSQIKPFDRLNAVAMGRDLERNNSKAIAIVEQLKVLTAGRIKAQFNTPDREWNAAADREFNRYFARDCFYREPMNLAEFFQLVEGSKVREGDVLIAFDDFLDGEHGSGQLLTWEADQLVTVQDSDWKDPNKNKYWCYTTENAGITTTVPYTQDSGLVLDRWGKIIAYIVVSRNFADEKCGYVTLPIEQCLIIPANAARLVKRRFRFGQRRGVPNFLPIADDLSDIDTMVKNELETAKLAGKILAYIKRSKDSVAADLAANMSNLFGEESTSEIEGEEPPPVEEATRYENLEEATGGNTIYGEEGDELQIPPLDRPNLNTTSFYDHRGDSAGASVGLSRGYTRMAVSNSYTAHRGETCMTWRHIHNRQKLHEWGWLDWLAEKVIERAIEREAIKDGPTDWKYMISWDFSSPDVIDPQKEAASDQLELKIGKSDYRKLLGPDWENRLREYSEQLKLIRELGLPLAILETVAGAPAPTTEQPEQQVQEE